MANTTVLIVEDEAIVAADLAAKLRLLGYEVVGTADGGEASVEAACRLQPQVVMMDIRLKGKMDGIQAAEAILQRHSVPVIYLTAHSDPVTLERAKLTGPFGYILKPFEERELASTIELALYKHRLESQLRAQRDALRESENRLQAANENLQLVNEELQAANEELQVQGEELQAQNQELARLWEETRIMKEKLAEKEERLQLALTSSGMASFDWDIINDRHTWDENVHRLLGTEPESITGSDEDFFRAMHPEDRSAVKAALIQAVHVTDVYETEYRAVRQDGSIRHIAAKGKVHCDKNDRPVRLIGICWDITDRKQAEQAMQTLNETLEKRVRERTEELAATIDELEREVSERRSAEENVLRLNRLHMVLSETNQAIVRTRDSETLFNDFCRIAVESGGFKLAWVGLVDGESGKIGIVASSGVTDYLNEIKITVDNEPTGHGPTGISVREGSEYICNDFLGSEITRPWHERGRKHGIRASASIALNQEGKVVGALTLYADTKDFFDSQQVELLRQMGNDISFALDNVIRETRRQEAEQALKEKEKLLIYQSRLAAMGEMIGNIAHQWRQPLNTLGLLVQQVPIYYKSAELSQKFLNDNSDKSMELIRHMSRTIDDFRNFFRPDKEKVEFRVHEEVAKTLSLMEGSLSTRQICVDVDQRREPVIYGYPNEFCQVLLNILSNARDVLLEREIDKPRVRITIDGEEKRAVVTIADNAGGIPEEIIDRIYDPYFTTKESEKGTGVGLFMSRTIIEKNMGGHLTARNANGGAEFRIEV